MAPTHRRWFKQANGPLPDPLPPIRKGGCPGSGEILYSCCQYPKGIWLNSYDWKHRPTLYHETGHWFDRQYLTDVDREEIRAHMGWPLYPWFWGDWDPQTEWRSPNEERFAWAYAKMCLHPREHKWLRRKLRDSKAGAA